VKYKTGFKALTGDICFPPATQICDVTSGAELATFAQRGKLKKKKKNAVSPPTVCGTKMYRWDMYPHDISVWNVWYAQGQFQISEMIDMHKQLTLSLL
jgi:hypothetical protein